MGRDKKFLSTSADDQNFKKKSEGGYAQGTTKKIRRGDVDREIKNISGKYEY